MTRHISGPAPGEGLGAVWTAGLGDAVFGMCGGAAVSTGSEAEVTWDCLATSAGGSQWRPRMRNTTPAAPTMIHFGKPDEATGSGAGRGDGGRSGVSLGTTTWGSAAWATELAGTDT